MLRLQLLGPVELATPERTAEVGPPQRRAVLAALAVDAGRPVGADVVIRRVWGTTPPEGARRSVYSHIARIRRICEQTGDAGGERLRLTRRSGGYVLEAGWEQVDVHRFRRLVDQARAARLPDPARASLLGEALGLWRGEPLSGLDGLWAEQVREAWRREQMDATVAWARVQTRLGDPAAAVGPLSALLGEHPLVEPLAEALMRALYAAGRGAEALDCYASVQQRLAEELGTDPGTALREIHQTILRGQVPESAAPTRPAAPPRPGPQRGVVPAQLPVGVRGFTGREEELSRLDTFLETARLSAPVVISAVSGTAGVGKTTLAVHWGHLVRKHFPDGQLYVNLRGFDPSGPLPDPAEALRGFLDAFGVPPARIPTGLEAQAALYRSLLADRRVLVVLDNALDAQQVRPLLPGAPGCLALVTSRNRLTSLAAAEGAHLLAIDVLSPAEARSLLADRLGARRTAAEPAAVADIVARCAGLPLALAVVAARAAAQPHIPLATLADELSDTGDRLDALDGGDPATQVRAVLSWSYDALSPAAAGLFRLLGLHPGPDVSAPAAASLAGVPLARARSLLAELTRTHLLAEPVQGRYSFHDLLRAYAGELAQSQDEEDGRRHATHRMLDHYLHTALRAQRLLGPPADRILPSPAQPRVVPEEPAGREAAMGWFTAEHPILLAAVRQAFEAGFDTHAWQLAAALTTYQQRRVLWSDWTTAHTVALAAARRLADPAAQACARRNLANAASALGRQAEARAHLEHAAELYRGLGDQGGEAHTRLALGRVSTRQGRRTEALDHSLQAVQLFDAAGDRAWQALALNNVGWDHALLGHHQKAIVHGRQALALVEQTGHTSGEAHTWDTLGYAHHHLGQYDEAAACYRQAAALFHDLGDRYYEADILAHLGDTHHAARNPAPARDAWTRSLTLFEELDHPDTEALRARLLHHLGKDPADTVLPERD
ncbi:BTAD domain-containing putative transcriptional regulator [Streptomyces sp. SID12488]|uniref:AfsR/SARP family transcriptional regulator n=1 Tax=Streptomyces sp. SID12488 TaxID=2706040 RepID=UPI0013DB6AA1|nr:BTAD domain-containing putative transcriptional regulator [Streptomyces sp. SID12488]NEA66763.1 tetratricopeptide repeat protein [Streptomyces sp. SID12488]